MSIFHALVQICSGVVLLANKEADRLVDHLRPLQRCLIAFSGGVDSSVVAKAARLALGFENCLAITARSPSVARTELATAKAVAEEIEIRHEFIETAEITNPEYRRNDGQRCFHCKTELYGQIRSIAGVDGEFSTMLNGTNFDDLGDYRPGLQAADDYSVLSPLIDLRFGKSIVRELARHWGLSNWDKPAAPCLASRIAYGESVTPDKLAMVEKSEAFLRQLGFKELRVRYHNCAKASVEVGRDDLPRLFESSMQQKIKKELMKLGFQEVVLDPEGFRSGKLNQLLPVYGISSPDSSPS